VNRSITLGGGALLVAGIVVLVLDLEVGTGSAPSVPFFFAILAIPIGVLSAFLGATHPDPSITTVRGFFGSEEENLVGERLRERPAPAADRRYAPSPRESVHCAKCYTLMPAQEIVCPRCGLSRRCESCHRPLFELAGAIRCAPCLRDEVYCSCSRLAAAPPAAFGRRGSPR
jgi:hypothetical protein